MQQLFFIGLVLGSLALASACGRNEDAVHWEDKPEVNLQFASESEIAGGAVVRSSYLVAFRNLLDEPQLRFSSYRRSSLAHFAALSQSWARPSILESIRYFSTLNLSRLSASFSIRRTVNPAPWLHAEPTPEGERLASLVEVQFRDEDEARQTLSSWYEQGRIWYAEPNSVGKLSGELEDRLIKNFGGDEVGKVSWLEQINFIQAIQELNKLSEKSGPLIAVMDSGVDIEHPDLKPAAYVNEIGQNKLDCKNDLYGCDATVSKKDLLGEGSVWPSGTTAFGQVCPASLGGEVGACEHGTHVAGIIAARDSEKLTGICPYCRFLAVKIVGPSKENPKELTISDSAQLAGLAYISGFQNEGEPLVRVINASYGRFRSTRSIEIFMKALKSFGRGTLTIAAAGNEDTMKHAFPAAFDDVLAVSNVVAKQTQPDKSDSSNFGMWVDIAAPGEDILSTLPAGNFGLKTGTSMAAPVVSGVAGLVLTKEPQLTAFELEERLLNTAIPDELYRDNRNNQYRPTINGFVVPLLGSGVVNAYAALRPDLDISPGLSTDRVDRVEPGCGVLGGSAPHSLGWLTFFLALPLVIALFRRGRHPLLSQ